MPSTTTSGTAVISIGELSRRSGVNIETIRYYERVGMMPHPPRTTSGRRQYGDMESRTLTFIRRARDLGFTLHEISALLALADEGGHRACVEVRDLAARHLDAVRTKIADLKAMEGVLANAVRRCEQGEPTDCPLIDTLSGR